MSYIFAWSLINLIDGEARWFMTFLAILTFAAVATHLWRWAAVALGHKFQAKNQFFKEASIKASLLPVVFYIWFVAFLKVADLVSDEFFSQSLPEQIKLFSRSTLVLTIAWFLFRLKNNVAVVLLQKSRRKQISMEPGSIHGMTKLCSVLIVIITLLLLLEVTGVSFNALIAFGGISGLAFAFASQEVIANFFGGVMIHVVQPFQVGDYIVLPSSSMEGIVEEVGWYETILRSKEMQPIYIPNSFFSKAFVVNNGRRSHRRIQDKISIRHDDLSKAASIINAIRTFLQGYESIDTAKRININIDQIGPYSIDISIMALSSSIDETEFLAVRDCVLTRACAIVEEHGAKLAIPRETVVPYEQA